MRDAEQQPLDVDLDFSSQTKTIQSHRAAYVRKDGFDEAHSPAVDLSPFFCVIGSVIGSDRVRPAV